MQGAAALLYEAINQLKAPSEVTAAQNRQFSSGVDELQRYADEGRLPTGCVIVHLGTNGTVNPADFTRMMGILANVRTVVVLTVKADRPWEAQVNDTIVNEAKKYKNVVVLDWHTIGGAHPEYFWDDAVHLRPEGAAAYIALVTQIIASNA
jgi:hypothetical protein